MVISTSAKTLLLNQDRYFKLVKKPQIQQTGNKCILKLRYGGNQLFNSTNFGMIQIGSPTFFGTGAHILSLLAEGCSNVWLTSCPKGQQFVAPLRIKPAALATILFGTMHAANKIFKIFFHVSDFLHNRHADFFCVSLQANLQPF